MFCPKCGTKNPEDGKFCRKCGTGLDGVSRALEGNFDVTSPGKQGRKKNLSWESAMSKLFMGVAFLVVSVVLGFTGVAGGQHWWFWMLIPAFAMFGTGVAEVIQLRQATPDVEISDDLPESIDETRKSALPEADPGFAAAKDPEQYETGDLVPPSVVENTTRHLEMDSEGETITLPKPD